jgi:hypothetical protein
VFLGFLAPPLAFSLGIFSTETYFYHHTSSDLDFSHIDFSKHLPNVASCLGIMIASSVFYFFIAWGMPFNWILPTEGLADIIGRLDETMTYPCDVEAIDEIEEETALFKVREISHIYPDGCAGKSTTMEMLCGTLPITFGDASVNGYSITRNKVLARRNLGICMQSDVLWISASLDSEGSLVMLWS